MNSSQNLVVSAPDRPIILDVWSDVACPWCWVGKRRLARAMADLPVDAVRVRWHAFELQPSLPPGGMDAAVFYAAKFGGTGARDAIFSRMQTVGQQEGIAFDFSRMRAPNTRMAHRLIQLAGPGPLQDALVEALFVAHFEQGVNVGVLPEIFSFLRARLPQEMQAVADALKPRLLAGEGESEVAADQALATELEVDGVPFFLANGRVALGGAQPQKIFADFLAEAQRLLALSAQNLV